METLKLSVISVIRNKGKEIDSEDFVRYFSYTKNWIPPDASRKLFMICIKANLLKKSGNKYVQNFEFDGVIPLDFKLTEDIVNRYLVREDVFTTMLDYICQTKGIPRKEALVKINQIKKDTIYVSVEVAALIYCKIEGIDCTDYYDEVEKKLVV